MLEIEKHNNKVLGEVYQTVSKDCEHKVSGRCNHPDRPFTVQGCSLWFCCKVPKSVEVKDTPKPAPQGRKDTISNRPDVY